MTDEVSKPGPVDTGHRDPAYAAQAPKQETQETPDTTEDIEESDGGEQNESEQTAASETDGTTDRTQKKGVGKRIDELTKNWRDTERDRDHWRELAMKAQQQPPKQPEKSQESTSNDDPEPTLEDAEWDVSKHQKDWYSWQRRQEKREEEQAKQAEANQAREMKLQKSAAAFEATAPDYNEVVTNPALPITAVMREAVIETDNPAAVAYWLGKNVEESRKIAGMSPVGVARAIAKIESQLERVEPEQRQPTQKTVTNAPPPPTTLTGSKVPVKKPEEMTMAEYAAHRIEERKAKGLRP